MIMIMKFVDTMSKWGKYQFQQDIKQSRQPWMDYFEYVQLLTTWTSAKVYLVVKDS